MPVTTAREQAAPVASGAADSPLGARIGPAWPALVIAALVAVAAGAVVRASIGRGHPSVARTAERGRALPRDGLLSLPLAAQGPVSAALGADERSYDFTGLRAVNPAQRLRIGFSRAGVTVASGRARLGLGLAGFGYAGALRRFGPASPRASANRLSYGHGSVREWFANGPLGLEQGFDVASRPSAGNGPLTLALALSGNLHPRLKDDSLLLQGRGVALRYRGLVASDAHGRLLHSWLALRGDRLLLRVDDRGAAYPLRIDPFVQQAELTFGEMESHFGYSVAISGDTLVVGAENFTPPLLHAGQGAAFVFVAPNSNWVAAAQKSELTSTYGESFDHLGSSVAISGSTVVAGAPEHQVGLTKDQGALSVFVEPPSGWEPVQSQNAELSVKGGAETEFLGD
ncbi:MAG TPA: hypothetical protein VKG62_04280 [Solirubrobacteraceae bacterium]|nr:hypothetical protein [Solirubrobacteraceae bacterium]